MFENLRIALQTLGRLRRVWFICHLLLIECLSWRWQIWRSLLRLTNRAWGRGARGFNAGLFPPCPQGIDHLACSCLSCNTSADGELITYHSNSFFLLHSLSWATVCLLYVPLSVLVLCFWVTENKSTMLISNKCSYTQPASSYRLTDSQRQNLATSSSWIQEFLDNHPRMCVCAC